jgi:hypothetical protein
MQWDGEAHPHQHQAMGTIQGQPTLNKGILLTRMMGDAPPCPVSGRPIKASAQVCLKAYDGISARHHHTSNSLEKKGPGREKPSHNNGKRRRAIAIACKAHKRSNGPELLEGEMNWGSTKHH